MRCVGRAKEEKKEPQLVRIRKSVSDDPRVKGLDAEIQTRIERCVNPPGGSVRTKSELNLDNAFLMDVWKYLNEGGDLVYREGKVF